MDVLALLSLRIIITFLSIGSSQMLFSSSMADDTFPNSDIPLQFQSKQQRWTSTSTFIGNGEEQNEEQNDVGHQLDLSSAGPTEYPPEFSKPDPQNKKMSFREAVVLAREEAKCLSKFGSHTNKTVMMGSTIGAIAQRLATPSGCFQSETSAQCEQCKNITAQPIEKLEECHQLCAAQDDSCRRTCLTVYQALRNSASLADGLSPSSNSNGEDMDNVSIFHHDNSTTPPAYKLSVYLSNGNGSSEAYGSAKQTTGHLIQSVGVFCEGVNYLDGSKRSKSVSAASSSNGEIHFVILKWNINETGLQHLADNSNSSHHNAVNDHVIPPISNSASNEHALEYDPLDSDKKRQFPLVYVIEQTSGNGSKWRTIGKTPFGLQTVNVSYHTAVYKWRITAVGPNGIEDVAETENYVTLDGYKSPGPPKKIYVAEAKVKNSSVDVLIGWEPPAENACFYKIVLEGTSGGKTETVRIKDQPLGLHMYWFEDLNFGTTYHVRMTSRDPSWRFESNLTKLEFKTPTCLESFNYRFDKCVPPPPSGIQVDIELAKGQQTSSEQQFLVTLTWLPPLNASDQNRVDKYVVEISPFILHQRPTVPKVNYTVGTKDPFHSADFTKHNYTVPGNSTKLTVRSLKPDTEYTVMITAYSPRGGSPGAQYHFNTKLAIKAELSQEEVGNWIYVTVTFTVAAVLLLLCNLIRIYINKRNVKIARNHYFQSMEERDEMGADWSIVPLTEDSANWKLFDENFPKEKWEIAWDDMTMGEVIGQGAFGVVRRAKIHRRKLELKLKIRGDDETWFNSADRHTDAANPEMETVAVKMVKVSSTRDDREQLIKEITMMQSLGFHSQIVGLLGACTKGRNLCLVLEYCPGGDLLTFVRKVRAKYWPTLGLSDSKMSNSPAFTNRRGITAGMNLCGQTNSGSGGHRSSFSSVSENRKSFDSSPINYADIGGFSASCSSPENSSPGFNEGESGKRDFIAGNSRSENNSIPPFFVSQGQQEFEEDDEFRPIDEKDVLSYARQIAMGMEYLEKNRVVHRDLACRNVLLMGDYKHVKISDFGLSRDIYTWNVYHQKSNGKLPIKWMAIESIFTHVFTTKSDVWSYGILLWELVTLGGTPYPGLGNTELFHLLKSGYRMERPDNCSEELYAVMKKCWRTAAASRPSFTELRRHVEMMMEAAEPNLYLSLMADLPADYFQLSSRSDIPLVGMVDEITTPLKDSPTGSFPTNHHFSRQRHSSSISTGTNGAANLPGESDYGGGSSSTKKHRNNGASRKSQSIYHNTSFSHRGDTDSQKHPGTRSYNTEQNDEETCFSSCRDKDCENKGVGSRTSLLSSSNSMAGAHTNTPSTSSSRISHNVGNCHNDSNSMSVSGGNSAPGGNHLSPQPNDQQRAFTRYDPATCTSDSNNSTHIINRRAPQRLSSTLSSSQYENSEAENDIARQDGDNCMERQSSVQSPDSGILMRGCESGNNYDLEQISFTGELENVFEEEAEDCGGGGGGGKDRFATKHEDLSPSATSCRSLEVDSNGRVRSPINSTSSCKLPDRSFSFKRHHHPMNRAQSQKSKPKFSLPFVTVNDMTIIENRTYDLRDS